MHVLFWWDMAYHHNMIDSATESFPEHKRSEGSNIQLIAHIKSEAKASRRIGVEQKKGAYHKQVSDIQDVMRSNALGNQYSNLSSMRERMMAMGKEVNEAQEKVHELGIKLILDSQVPEDELTVIQKTDGVLIRMLKERYVSALKFRDELVVLHDQQKRDVEEQSKSVQILLATTKENPPPLQTPSPPKRPSSIAISENSKSLVSALSATPGDDEHSHSDDSDEVLFEGGLTKRQKI